MKSVNYVLILIVLLLNSCKTTEVEIPKSSAKEITSIELSGITGSSSSFDKPTNTYTFTVPVGTNIKAIPFSITIPTGATANPKSGSVLDFTNPVSCTITAEDGTSVKYMIIVLVQKSSQKQILSFSFDELNPAIKATINQTAFEITAELPSTTNLKSLKPTITLSDKASVSPASGSVQDFTNSVKYTVTAEDGSVQTYSTKFTQKTIVGSVVDCKLSTSVHTLVEDGKTLTNFTDFYTYYVSGNIQKITSYEKDQKGSGDITNFTYTNGLLVSERGAGSVNTKYQYSGGDLSKIQYYSNDRFIGELLVTLDINKRIKTMIVQNSIAYSNNPSDGTTSTFTYDAQGNCTLIEQKDKNGALLHKTEFLSFSNGIKSDKLALKGLIFDFLYNIAEAMQSVPILKHGGRDFLAARITSYWDNSSQKFISPEVTNITFDIIANTNGFISNKKFFFDGTTFTFTYEYTDCK